MNFHINPSGPHMLLTSTSVFKHQQMRIYSPVYTTLNLSKILFSRLQEIQYKVVTIIVIGTMPGNASLILL